MSKRKPGQSGNPAGRPKGTTKFQMRLRELLAALRKDTGQLVAGSGYRLGRSLQDLIAFLSEIHVASTRRSFGASLPSWSSWLSKPSLR
jgi:Family of unknown function (DUF5681)